MSYYRTREGDVTASDTFTVLSSLYGVSTTASIILPSNVSTITGIMASFASDMASNGVTTYALRLEGDGLSQGSEIINFGSHTTDGTPVSNGQNNDVQMIPVNIPVVANNQISVSVAMSADTGSCESAVTLVLE